MKMTFDELTVKVFQTTRRPLTAKEIVDEAIKMGLMDRVQTKGKTPWKTISSAIYKDIKENPKTRFSLSSRGPVKFYLNTFDILEPTIIDECDPKCMESNIQKKQSFNERDLHPLLVKFLYSNPHFKCYIKTIYHENSKRGQKGYNEWLHPDLVGIYFPFDDYSSETKKLQEAFKISSFKLFSFEMKIKLNFSNLREYYFQAVSNSSWAHEGYLVTLEIEDDTSLYDELRRLNNAFGIGVIKLNAREVEQSEIVFPSKEREFIDLDTVDRLARENRDFRSFIDDITEDIKVGKVKSSYDRVFEEDEYTSYLLKKGIL